MIMPPYHGATLRVSEEGVFEFYRTVAEALRIPVVMQDAPLSGTVLSANFLARLAQEIENVSYFKIEGPGATAKIRELIRLASESVMGAWDGEEGITLLADLDAGATGSITGGGYPDGMRPILDDYRAGRRTQARERFEQWLPLINIENRQCGLLAAKALMKEGGIIDCDKPRSPFPGMHPASRELLLSTARRLDALVLRWAA
jgi:dihydrodipicolinate synthase/N-acetylneuraminate lyase